MIGPFALVGCFHPSQQNTFTGRLTPAMLDDVLERARELAGLGPETSAGSEAQENGHADRRQGESQPGVRAPTS
jgi:hypothetical protein